MRAANIRTSTGRTNRPIVKLIPLEVSAQDNKNSKQGCKDNTKLTSDRQEDEVGEPHPMRNSAKKARKRLTQWASILSAPPEDVIDS